MSESRVIASLHSVKLAAIYDTDLARAAVLQVPNWHTCHNDARLPRALNLS